MVKGKFEGAVVNVDPNGRTYHGTFVDGHKTKDWSPGAGSGSKPAGPAEETKPKQSPPTEVASNARPAESPTEERPATKSVASAKPSGSAGDSISEPEFPAEGPD